VHGTLAHHFYRSGAGVRSLTEVIASGIKQLDPIAERGPFQVRPRRIARARVTRIRPYAAWTNARMSIAGPLPRSASQTRKQDVDTELYVGFTRKGAWLQPSAAESLGDLLVRAAVAALAPTQARGHGRPLVSAEARN
jgi:hypothetical protein